MTPCRHTERRGSICRRERAAKPPLDCRSCRQVANRPRRGLAVSRRAGDGGCDDRDRRRGQLRRPAPDPNRDALPEGRPSRHRSQFPRRAIRREGRSVRGRLRALACDATAGHARDVLAAVADGASPRPARPARTLGEPPYDLVVGDLFYSQLLYPALRDAGLSGPDIDAALDRHGDAVTATAVAALHETAPRVVHLHDPIAWWDGHAQPFTLAQLLACKGLEASEALIATGQPTDRM